MKFLSNLDLQQNQLLKAVLQNVTGGNDGSGLSGISGVEGQILYNTDNDLVYIYTGEAWATIGSDATITITAGDNLNGGGSFNLNDLNGSTITIDHDTITQSDTTTDPVPAAIAPGGTFTVVDSVSRDTYGHVTGINVKTVTLPADLTATDGVKIQSRVIKHTNSVTAQTTSGIYPVKIDAQGHISEYGTAVTALKNPDALTITADGGTPNTTYDGSEAVTLDIAGGNKITTATADGSVTIDHDALAGNGYETTANEEETLSDIQLLSTLSVDGYGHVDSAEFRKLVAGTYLGIAATDDGNITFSHNNTAREDGTNTGVSPAFGAAFTLVDEVATNATGHVTGVKTKTITMPTETTLSVVDNGTGTWLTDVTVNDHQVTLSRSNTTTATITVGELVITKATNPAQTGNLTVGGNAVITGNLTVSGTTTTLNTQEVVIEDNIIEINSSQEGIPASSLVSGIRVNRGQEDDFEFVFVEEKDDFRLGEVGSLQPVLTRDEVTNLTDGEVLIWDDANNRAIGGGTLQDLGGVKKFAGTITGDGNATQFTVANSTHGIGNKYMTIAVYEASSGEQVFVNTVVNQTTFQVAFNFAVAPAIDKLYEFVLIG